MHKKFFSWRFFGALAILSVATAAHAAPEVYTVERPAQVSPQDLGKSGPPAPAPEKNVRYDSEGLGLYQDAADDGLGKNLWAGSKRSELVKLLDAMPVNSRHPGLQHLIYGVLLTDTETEDIKNDIAPTPGQDLLSLRLRRLLDAGAYKQAIELYTLVPVESQSESIVRSGIYAMLFTGEKSLACVEMNTVIDRYAASGFFKTMAAYCDATLSEKPSEESWRILRASADKMLLTLATDKNFTFDYTPGTFDRLSPLERAAIVAEGRLKSGVQRTTDFKKVPPAHLQLLMKATDLSEKDKFLLNVRAVEWGLMRVQDFKKTYTSALDPDIRRDPALAVPDSAEDWQKLPYLLQLATNSPTDEDKWAYIRQSFPIGDKYGLAALTPFADEIGRTAPGNPPLADIKYALGILVRAESAIPQQLIDIIKNYSFFLEQKQDESRLLSLALVAQTQGQADPVLKERILSSLPGKADLLTSFLKAVIENIDKSGPANHNAIEIYENEKNLTLPIDYVMPSTDIWNRLIDTGREGITGETVLLSATTLNESTLGSLYPAYFQDTLQSLEYVGLTDVSRNLAMEAILENIKY